MVMDGITGAQKLSTSAFADAIIENVRRF